MLDWFARISAWLKLSGVGAGYLLSTFSGRLSEGFQDLGLWVGFAIGTAFLVGLALHVITHLRGGKSVSPVDLVTLGLGGMVVFLALASAGALYVAGSRDARALP
jgi:hypothetical protein